MQNIRAAVQKCGIINRAPCSIQKECKWSLFQGMRRENLPMDSTNLKPRYFSDKTSEQEGIPKQKSATDPQHQAKTLPIVGDSLRVSDTEGSLTIPTATSCRTIPVKILEENSRIIKEYLDEDGQDDLSFTHLISWAVVCSLKYHPGINSSFQRIDGIPRRRFYNTVNLGITVDIERDDGTRTLLVPNIQNAGSMKFLEFLEKYREILSRMQNGNFEPSDFNDTTITLTNPGTVGTLFSVPRLLQGQGAVIAMGIIGFPAQYHGWPAVRMSNLGLNKVMTVSCTYDHRIIQDAESGKFLGCIEDLLLGEHSFYEGIFESLRIPAMPFRWSRDSSSPMPHTGCDSTSIDMDKQAGVQRLINRYRVRGHMIADLDPLGNPPVYHPELDPATFGLTPWDLDREFSTGDLGGLRRATFRQILAVLRAAYCKSIGVEFRHIQDAVEKDWVQDRLEPEHRRLPLDSAVRLRILRNLINAEMFEKFLHLKFVGHKRFSLEGSETVIPVLAEILSELADSQVEEAVLGMAHRGRLNVLANIVGIPVAKIFREFEENFDPYATQGSGDVKYHLGSSGKFRSDAGNGIFLSLAPNPSHLEWVNPVIEGIVRAKQDHRGDTMREKVVPILIHGDAAFAGQGVAYESLNLSQLYGYGTGGTIHLIINNQIGFTTPSEEARSSVYATDVARSVQAPIFHVNGDDPDASVRVALLAVQYRQQFKKDVVIDIYCYRRHGHSETDEPSLTQPLLYKIIQEKPSVMTLYARRLFHEGIISHEALAQLQEEVRKSLEHAYADHEKEGQDFSSDFPLAVSPEDLDEFQPTGGTAVGMELLRTVSKGLSSLPNTFRIHPKLVPFIEERWKLVEEDPEIDWSFAEALAFGTLVYEGTPIRLSGQDSARGTFSQRHAVLTDYDTGEEYVPLSNISRDQAPFRAYDSLLSEAAVLGFEFGYSSADPLSLVLWEAQFGDFANGAQVIIDNFISSSESKWGQPCDLVLLLPHGFDGQGPEHSSSRLERFLGLCAEDNMQVCFPTTPSQYFHLLRRQMRDAKRVPLVVLTPKSILRHPAAKSRPQELAKGKFEMVLDDPHIEDINRVKRLLLCCGKIYYELSAERENNRREDIAIVRIEQLYPFPEWTVSNILSRYKHAGDIIWVQEEPLNMGAWHFISRHIAPSLPFGTSLRYVGRPESSSPAAGSRRRHRKEQETLLAEALE